MRTLARSKQRIRTIVAPPLKASVRRRLTKDEQHLHAELGKLIRAWSNLHELLASVFAKVLLCDSSVAYAAWHSMKSDLSQRDALVAALKARIRLLEDGRDRAIATGSPEIAAKKNTEAKLLAEYHWVVNEITKFSHKRNDLIHSPIVFFHGGLDASTATEFEAIVSDMHGNPRAVRVNKDHEIFQLCGWTNAFLREATKFIALLGHFRPEHAPLPSRPQWPSTSLFPTRKQLSRQRPVQRPKLPPAPE